MTLVVLSGLPGVGKSTLAQSVAAATGALWLRIDSIEAGLAASHLQIPNAMDAGYRAAVQMAADNLALGHIVIADAVNGWAPARSWWRLAASQSGAALIPVTVTCPSDIHRARVEGRHADDPDTPNWAMVQAREYEAWPDATIIDASLPDAAATLTALMRGHVVTPNS